MRIGKYKIITLKEYLELKNIRKYWDEREAIIKDNAIQQEKEKLQKKYKKYFGRYYVSEEGFVFRIEGIKYNSHSYSIFNKWQFYTSAVNNPDWDFDIDVDEIIDGTYGKPIKNPKYI